MNAQSHLLMSLSYTLADPRVPEEMRKAADTITRLTSENEKLRAALEKIRARRYQNRETVSPENAFEAFGRLNAEVCAIYAECDAALTGKEQG